MDTNFLGFFMTKYTVRFKISVVKKYLGTSFGYKTIAQHYGLDHGMVRRWVLWYKTYGTAGMRKKFCHYSGQFKLSVLQHMWNNELSYLQVAAVFDIRSPGCLSVWERRYHSGGIDALTPRPRGRPKKMLDTLDIKPGAVPDDDQRSRDELVAELGLLRAQVAYLKKLKALVQAQAARKKRK